MTSSFSKIKSNAVAYIQELYFNTISANQKRLSLYIASFIICVLVLIIAVSASVAISNNNKTKHIVKYLVALNSVSAKNTNSALQSFQEVYNKSDVSALRLISAIQVSGILLNEGLKNDALSVLQDAQEISLPEYINVAFSNYLTSFIISQSFEGANLDDILKDCTSKVKSDSAFSLFYLNCSSAILLSYPNDVKYHASLKSLSAVLAKTKNQALAQKLAFLYSDLYTA